MQITKQFKLLLTVEQEVLINNTLMTYIDTANQVLTDMIDYDQHYRFSSKQIKADLPSCLKAQIAGDAVSMDKKRFKHHIRQPVLKKPYAIWNNQNFKITENDLTFPVWNGKSCRITVKALIPPEMFKLFQKSNLGAMRITKKNDKYIAQIAVDVKSETINENSGIMGVDLGLKCPAVSVTDSGKVKFFGNGRKNKQIKRHFQTKRKKLQKKKKINAIRKIENKEHRIMNDIDHKLSRQIVNYAYANGIKTIKLEILSGIHRTTRQSRKNNHELSNWSFYRLQGYIKYKAALLDIDVIEVDPKYTSQICPVCGKHNKAHDRKYTCDCGYTTHRDIVGAYNIMQAAIT